ncbi:MAG: glycoside hydrolase family 3 [Chloroflexi bacterium B3_Chlor]|nr:MAG: glycoside hydrolase family 3 [Chloroflexi bacterium B3_Chlor]
MATMVLLSGCGQSPEEDTESDVDLDVEIGQMLMVGFRGFDVSDDHPVVRDVQDRLGGVVLFDYDVPSRRAVRNIESPAQVEVLVEGLKGFSAAPLLVALDHEGGLVTRLKEGYGFPPTVSHQYLGETNDLARTREQASMMARTLAELGINLNLAPVVDLNTNRDNPAIAAYGRSFSADPDVVTEHALEFIRAHHEQGVLCTLKHFPGHGSSTADSHRGLTDVTDTWSRIELEPYRNVIEVGDAYAIMTAHVFNANLDPERPAILSKPTITGILREELDYDGVVIFDDMQLGAIAQYYGLETAIEAAIEAGVDILAFANNSVFVEDVAARAFSVIKRLVGDGRVSEERIRKSYGRIQRLKSRL